MKNFTKRISVLLMVICLLASLVLPASAAPSATNIVTTPTGYTSAADVTYPASGYIANWGARGEIATFVSAKASDYYTAGNTYDELTQWNGGTGTTASGSDLYAALSALAIAQQHTLTTYDGCRDLYGYTDCVLGDTSKLSLFYMGDLVSSTWDSGVTYNREHTWPKSKLTSESTNDGADIMHIRPSDPSTNSSRSNTAYGESSGYYDPGVSVRGDVARITLYMYVRWGNESNLWGTGGVFESLDVLLAWNAADPVDTWEMGRNDAIQSITGARNMFVDYPELAYHLFSKEVPADLVTPSSASADSGSDDTGSDDSTTTPVVSSEYTIDFSIAGQRTTYTTEQQVWANGAFVVTNDKASSTSNVGNYTNPARFYANSTVTFDCAGLTKLVIVSNAAKYATALTNSITAGTNETVTVDGNNVTIEFANPVDSYVITLSAQVRANSVTAYCAASDAPSEEVCEHTYDEGVVTAPTCTLAGYTTYTCTLCGDSYSGDVVEATGHQNEEVSRTEPTCTTAGESNVECTLCGSPYSYTLAATGHTYVDGVCSVCGAVSGNDYTIDFSVADQRTTYTTEQQVWTNGTFVVTNDKASSTSNVADYTNPARFYKSSSLTFSCANMNKLVIVCNSASYATALNSSITAGTNETVTLDGSTVTIEFANPVDSYEIASLGAQVRVNSATAYIATSDDSTEEECEHDYVGVVTAPTCTEGGYTTYTCSKCNDSYVGDETETVDHNYESVVTAPTCTSGGYTTDTCTVCGWYEKHTFVDPTGHTYVNGVCSVCGDAEVVIDLSGTYYIAAIRTAGGNYFYAAGAMNGTRYNAVDSGLATLPSVITAPEANMVFVFEKNEDGTYCIKVDGTDTYLGWNSGNTGELVAQDSALSVTVTVSEGCYLIHFTADDGVRYLSLNDTDYNYFAWYREGQAKNLYLIPVEACNHSYSTQITAPTCTEAGQTIYNCSVCGHSYTEIIKATGHNYVNGVCSACGDQEVAVTITEVTIDFSTTDQRVSQDTEQQVWANGDFTLTNDKASSTNNVADYSNPARFYAKSTLTFDCAGLTKLVIVSNAAKYTTALTSSITAGANETVTVDGNNVTIEFINPVDTYVITLGAQVRVNSVTAYAATSAEAPHEHSYESVVTAPTCTAAGYTTYTCSGCGDSYTGDEVAALGHASYTYSYDSTNKIHSFTCTVCGEVTTKTATDGKKFAINSAAPVLSDDIILKYRATIPAGFEFSRMEFLFNDEVYTYYDYVVDGERISISFPYIIPQKMGDNICATLYATVDGVEVSVQIANYSMLKYCDNQLKKTTLSDTLRTLYSDVLAYGASVQIMMNYKADDLVTGKVTDPASLKPSTFPGLDDSYNLMKRTGTALDNLEVSGVTVMLGSKVNLRYTIKTTDLESFTYKVQIKSREYTFTGADLVPTSTADTYYLYFDGAMANELGEKITLTCWDGDTQVSRTVEYSVYTYVYRNYANSSKTEAERNLLMALFNYGESTKNAL